MILRVCQWKHRAPPILTSLCGTSVQRQDHKVHSDDGVDDGPEEVNLDWSGHFGAAVAQVQQRNNGHANGQPGSEAHVVDQGVHVR